MIQRVNLALGGALVAKVKVVSGKFARATAIKPKVALTGAQRDWAERSAQRAQDPELKAALRRLAEAVAAENGPTIAPLRPKS